MVKNILNGGKTRVAIDTAMILAMATLLWNGSGWVKEINISVQKINSNSVNQQQLMHRVDENDRRITSLEAMQVVQYEAILGRLERIEDKVDRQ